jgi:chemotaxis protein MotB
MSRRRRRAGHANHERWLVSYADFITLLFAFFVVLYASAQVDKRKIGKLAFAIQTAFQDLGVLSPAAMPLPLDPAQPIKIDGVQAIATAQQVAIAPSPEGSPDADLESPDLSKLQTELKQALQHEIAVRAIALHRESQGLVISLREFGFFDSGSADLKPTALPALDRIASILAVRPCSIRVEGHTDNVPIHTPQMASNWELSTARSSELVRVLVQRYHFAPERLSAAGYAQYHPIASNDTEQGRAQNRRVDLVILNEPIRRNQALAIPDKSKPSPGIP